MNGVLLRRALAALNARGVAIGNGQSWFVLDGVRCRITDGKLVVPEGQEHLADKLKISYAREVVKYTAQRAGWQIKETRLNVFEVVK